MQLAPRQLDLFRLLRAPGNAPAAREPGAAPAAPTALPTFSAGEAELELTGAPPSRQQTLTQARELAQRLADHIGRELKVLLTVHDNRSTMISFRRQPPLLRIRLHHMFLDAPDDVVRAVVEYAGRGRRASGPLLDSYIAARQERIRSLPKKASELEPRGQCFDLGDVFDRLNDEHFQGGIRARIGWGRQPAKRRRRSIRLGVYDHKAREIRLHPSLDRPDVPRFFVEFIVFHEMLHQLFPSDRRSGRHVHHPRAFRDREKAFPRYAAAMAWEKENLHALLRR